MNYGDWGCGYVLVCEKNGLYFFFLGELWGLGMWVLVKSLRFDAEDFVLWVFRFDLISRDLDGALVVWYCMCLCLCVRH